MNNDNYFNIYSYMESKQGGLVEKDSLDDVAIVCLNEDSNGEPYIEIDYIDYDGQIGGLTSLEKLDAISEYADYYTNIFDVFSYNAIVSILYNLDTKQLDLINLKDKSCVDCDLTFNENSISVGYIINKKINFDFKTKVKILYELMKIIMLRSYEEGLKIDVVFKVKNQIISNIYQYDNEDNLEPCELSEQINLSIIKNQFEVDLRETYQKIKK